MSKWQRLDSANKGHLASATNGMVRTNKSGFAGLLTGLFVLVIFFIQTRAIINSRLNDQDSDAPAPSEAARAKVGLEAREKAVREQPDNPWAYQQRGEAFYNLGLYDKAIADLSKTISMVPVAEEAHVFRARCYLLKNEYEKAMPDYSATINSKYPFFGYRGRGICYYHLGDYRKAVDDFTSALKAIPGDREVLHDRGMAYKKLNLQKLADDDLDQKGHLNVVGPPFLRDLAPFLFPDVNHVSKYWLQ